MGNLRNCVKRCMNVERRLDLPQRILYCKKSVTQIESSLTRYSISEEIANSITHGVGIILTIGALGILTAFASIYGIAERST